MDNATLFAHLSDMPPRIPRLPLGSTQILPFLMWLYLGRAHALAVKLSVTFGQN